MNRKMSKRQKDIKSKLMAAVAMLLVSSIMMVSTTYAWFTLSTAPEVKGISTAVGANGNLEMALMPLSGKTNDITSAVGDSINATGVKTESNVTWGNLVDLEEAYGLENITLYPSALNVDDTSGNINTAFPVEIPEYGVDGRVTDLNDQKAVPGYYTTAGTFLDSALDKEGNEIDDPRGVRAIGVASGASPAQLAYKAAIMKASQAATNAQNKASGILIEKGGNLADIAIKYVNEGESATYTDDDIANLQAMLDAVYGTEENPGSLLIIRNAIKEYMVADYISKNSDYTEAEKTIRGLTDLSADAAASYIPDSMEVLVEALNTAIENAKAAQDAMPEDKDSYSWSDISGVVDKLAKTEYMKLNSFKISELTSNISQLMSDVMAGSGITLYLTSGAGVFVDIADFCGDYAAPVVIPEISYNEYHMENVPVTMQTQSEVSPTYLSQAKTATADAPGDAAEGALPLSDFYGYIIDLAFRTNVVGSNLQLQTAAVDRIYSDNETNENTMGGGSTMIFKSTDPNFTPARMIELMEHLKVVLFDPDDGEIIKYLKITDVSTEITTAADGTVTAPLYLANADGTYATRQKTDATGTGVTDTDGNAVMEKDPTIMALDQNTIYQLSALVYLDGTDLTNADVANAAQSMAGALNLQFSSSAELVPMEYADLRNGTVQAPEGGSTPVVKDVTTGSITTGYAATIKHVAVGETYKLVAVITETAGSTPVTTGTVTIGGESATYATAGGVSGWVVDATETVPVEAVDVTVGA